jgi:hypothetical protein
LNVSVDIVFVANGAIAQAKRIISTVAVQTTAPWLAENAAADCVVVGE